MSLSKIFQPRILISIGLILILAVVAFGYAAANTVPPGGAGDGTGVVSGYTISAITYGLNVADPSLIDTVSFIVTSDATQVIPATQVRISVNGGTTWSAISDCVAPEHSTDPWVCTFTAKPTVVSADNLEVVATS